MCLLLLRYIFSKSLPISASENHQTSPNSMWVLYTSYQPTFTKKVFWARAPFLRYPKAAPGLRFWQKWQQMSWRHDKFAEMAQIFMVRPLYIDDELELKKFENLFKMPPRGGPTPILGPIYWKVPGRPYFWPDTCSNSTLGCQKLISVEISLCFPVSGTYGPRQIGRKGALHILEARLI